MLWGGKAELIRPRLRYFYKYTNYGDAEAFKAKREALSSTTPERELDTATLNALTPQQRCFGEYSHFQLITHALLHGGIIHLVGNMLFLVVLGSRVNAAIGNILTAILYPVLAVAAALTHLATMGAEPPTPMLGASGAVMGLAGAYLLLYPVHKIYMAIWLRAPISGFRLLYKAFPVPGFCVVLFYIMFDVIALILTARTGTAHWAHIGGLISGFVIAFVLLAARLAYSRSDVLSLALGRHAWPIIGNPNTRNSDYKNEKS
jgi:membrane associated rhomboid family serine protease